MTAEPRARSPRHRGGRWPKPDAPRRAAYEVLRAVDERDAYANLLLPPLLRDRGLTGRDAAFATELVYGSLRRRGTWDAVLSRCVDRPLEQVDDPLRDVLRLGVHQLLGMRVPVHAAVSATVELTRAVIGPGPAGFVNAVLRKVAGRSQDTWLGVISEGLDELARLSVVHSHPRWVVSAFADALHGDLAEVAAALTADNEPPAVSLVARPYQATVAELIASGAAPGRWSPVAATLGGGDPHDIPAVAEGRAGVQDEGSQLVTIALARAELSGPDARWLDLCAGPGGKAALLAGLAARRSAALLAVERQPTRARLVADALDGTPTKWGMVVADGRVPVWRAGAFDRVLVDAPCTGLGALRRRPEARWRRQPADVARLRPLQYNLLQSALDAARPGGLVAYVTCTPHIGETKVIVWDTVRQRSDVDRVDARPYLEGVPNLGDGPDVQLWPHRHGTDAMYLALLQKR
jgi:16S rRNA (cytosine967-C5)-methyltransferase